MARRWVRWLRVVTGIGFIAVAVVTAMAVATEVRDLVVPCDVDKLVMCARFEPPVPPPPDWTPVVALAAVGIVLLWPRRQVRSTEDADLT